MIKECFYLFHIIGIFTVLFGFFLSKYILFIQFITLISWKLNKNRCILTQLEDYLFGESLTDIFFRLYGLHRKYIKYVVPKYQRRLLYTSFTTGLFYHFLYKRLIL